ncbi:hypothetical protein [Pseudoxanthomonas sp. CF125]|uniref:hypothetical protein n=1 Tax=Pseudoxanthomonas sp. CF125 TaxID=1855303 RepID=UPI00087E47A0|nr:hypothetical protein [Pseudoxanthomonas sp. CF125]SDQ47120.1 hypothetical protein SAMN05216569_1252 [Pseudoxanthomonas sp. CF125]
MLRRLGWYGLPLAAVMALWLLFAEPPGRVMGLDMGQLGMVLLVGVACMALYATDRALRNGFESAASPGEWKARNGFVFILGAVLFSLISLETLGQSFAVVFGPDTRAVGRNLVMLLGAWILLSRVARARWKHEVQEDERDREITARASRWGHGGLVFCVIAMVVTLNFSPSERLIWATPVAIANLLIFALMLGSLLEYGAAATYYWRDRR